MRGSGNVNNPDKTLWDRVVNPDKSKAKPIQMDLFG